MEGREPQTEEFRPTVGRNEAQNKRRPTQGRGREKGEEGKEGKKNDSQVQQAGWWSLLDFLPEALGSDPDIGAQVLPAS